MTKTNLVAVTYFPVQLRNISLNIQFWHLMFGSKKRFAYFRLVCKIKMISNTKVIFKAKLLQEFAVKGGKALKMFSLDFYFGKEERKKRIFVV